MAKQEAIKDAIVKGQELKVGNTLTDLINRSDYKRRFEELLGKKAPSFIASILSLYNTSPALKVCDPRSILSAAAIAATLDLPINPNLGFAAIVPYKGVAQFQMMWRGFVQLAIRTGIYQTMNAAEIYEGELVEYNRVTGEVKIDESKQKSDKVVAYVAYFKLVSGFQKFFLMTKEKVTAHGKRYSRAFNSGPWQTHFDEMALKTVLKSLLSKYGILSVELQKAIQYDQAVVTETPQGEKIEYPDAPALEGPEKEDPAGTAIEP